MIKQYPLAFASALGIALAFGLRPVSSVGSSLLFVGVALMGGAPLVLATLRNMVQGKFYVDTIATLAIVGSVALGEYQAGALVVLMQSGGEALEDYGLRRANRSLDNLLRRAPSIAHRRRGDQYEDIPASALIVGDIVLVRPGDIIATDGVVTEGGGSVDESALTGEPVPLAKGAGDQVYSGTINLNGSFHMRTTNPAAQSKFELIVRMVQQAQGEKAPINRLVNQYTPAFTLLTFLLTAFVLVVLRDPVRALSVLVVATPCPLIIATPLAVLSAINRAASLNIIVKGGAALEEAGRVRRVVFDKTGTLTIGTPSLESVTLFDKELEGGSSWLVNAVANVELLSTHVLGSAVIKEARRLGHTVAPADDYSELPGIGVSGVVDGKAVHVGSSSYLISKGIVISQEQDKARIVASQNGRTVGFVGIDSAVVGMLIFADQVRAEAPHLMLRLEALKLLPPVMLTGDSEETANAVAKTVGVKEVRARVLPEDKLSTIKGYKAAGSVMMVGDGINDAPALAAANVGVAMGGFGAGIATDAADVVITVENVERVADVIELGRTMLRVARQGILFGMGASIVLMILATMGHISPSTGALLQEAIDLAAILNALRSR